MSAGGHSGRETVYNVSRGHSGRETVCNVNRGHDCM